MKALIRNEGETVTQDMGFAFIDWNTGAPLTNESWSGGPYVLVENYDPSVCEVVSPDEFFERAGVGIADTEIEFTIQERGTGANHVNNSVSDTVTIDGKTYTKDELLALLNQTN